MTRDSAPKLTVRLLGPVCLHTAGGPVPVRGQRQLRFLAALALTPGRVVTKDTLVEGFWDGDPPRTVTGQLQTSAWMIRSALHTAGLPRDTLASHSAGSGYRLNVPPECVDAVVFRQSVRDARGLFNAGAFREAHGRLGKALSLWNGPALADVTASRFRIQADALDREWTAAAELHALSAIELGDYDEAIAQLSDRLDHDPLREDLYCSLMTAYYRAGRPADAIRVFHRAKDTLREHIGVSPGDRLLSLMQSVLRHDEHLMSGTAAGPAAAGAAARRDSAEIRQKPRRHRTGVSSS